jgi:mono/diheme cytochrome c family protein
MDALNATVRVVRMAVLVTAAAFAILLFTNEPQKLPAVPATGTANAGRTIFATRCAGCHGADGGGGFGPALGGGVVVERFPNVAAQEAVVANGRGSMPTFQGSLTPEQIATVVAFTRTGLG